MAESLVAVRNIDTDQKDDDTLAKQFVDEIESLVKDLSQFTLKKSADIAGIVLIAMKSMSALKYLKGASKQLIVVAALKKVVMLKKIMGEIEKQILVRLIEDIAPPLIEAIYNAASNKIKFNPKDGFCCIPAARVK